MNKLICASIATLTFATGAFAQAAAKSTSALKTAHTVNDGAAEAGVSSFTQQQAREHIANSGFGSISALTKGDDGVWRGTAVKHGHRMKVALDFKGNVSTSAAHRH